MTGRVRVTGTCLLCGKPSAVVVDADRWAEYERGLRERLPAATHGIQVLFPDLTPGERETLISGSHEACFDRAFGSDE